MSDIQGRFVRGKIGLMLFIVPPFNRSRCKPRNGTLQRLEKLRQQHRSTVACKRMRIGVNI